MKIELIFEAKWSAPHNCGVLRGCKGFEINSPELEKFLMDGASNYEELKKRHPSGTIGYCRLFLLRIGEDSQNGGFNVATKFPSKNAFKMEQKRREE